MAWTIPRTWTALTPLGATDLNTHLRDQLNVLKDPPFQQNIWSGTAVTTASTAVPIDTANLSISLTTYGGAIHLSFQGYQDSTNAAFYTFQWDGTAFNSGSALVRLAVAGMVRYDAWVTGLASGSHTFTPLWWQAAGLNVTLRGTSANAIFWAREG